MTFTDLTLWTTLIQFKSWLMLWLF